MSFRLCSSLGFRGASLALFSVERGNRDEMDGLVEHADRDLAKLAVEVGGGQHGGLDLDEVRGEDGGDGDVAEEIGGEDRVVEVAVDHGDGEMGQREGFERLEDGGVVGGVGTSEDAEIDRARDEYPGRREGGNTLATWWGEGTCERVCRF